MSVRRNEFAQPYVSYLNNVAITGARLDKMISDKLYATSDKGVCIRVVTITYIGIGNYSEIKSEGLVIIRNFIREN